MISNYLKKNETGNKNNDMLADTSADSKSNWYIS